MILKTEAIVLQMTAYSNTSRLVTWLTPEAGRLTTMIKGACRPKSPFLGAFDYFYSCELLYYTHAHDGLRIARECTPLNTRPRFRSDWRACACASYVSHLAYHSSVEGNHAALYSLLEDALDRLAADGASLPLLFWVELRLLHLLGVSPQMEHCARCRTGLTATGPHAFSDRAGGLLCEGCVRHQDRVMPIGPDHVALIRRWQTAESFSDLRGLRLTPRQLPVIQRILGVFAAYHLDIPPESRALAMALAATP